MCGLCGIWYFESNRNIEEPLLRHMTTALAHRGPDDEAYYIDHPNSIGLGFRRLSIIDPQGSSQPFVSEDQAKVIVGNGEIYNFRELRASLCTHHRFQTRGDIETILHLYEEDAEYWVQRLRGMFAFALWDSTRQQLTLAVDHFGQKPLYYGLDREKLIFGSELKALLRYPAVSREIDAQALDEYLSCGYITAPRSIFRSVRKLPPGCTLTFDRTGAAKLRQFWQPTFSPPDQYYQASFDELAADLRCHLLEAVRRHAVSDVPVGAFLSGGIDSSAVVALLHQAGVNTPLRTFSAAFAEQPYDESQFSHLIADHFATHHEVVRVLPPAARDSLPALIQQFDEPFADSSMIPTLLVARQASKSVKVVLSGDGGDEVFAGYFQHLYGYRQSLLESLIPAGLHSSAARAAQLLPAAMKVKPYLAALDQPYSRWTAASGFFTSAQRRQLYSCEFGKTLSAITPQARDPRSVSYDGLSQLQYADLTTYLPGDILVKVDRAAMLASLEVRSPLLDLDLFEFMARVPPAYKVGLRSGKRLLKRALEPVLPAAIFQREKQGFSIPQAEWLRSAFAPQVWALLDHSPHQLFDPVYVQNLVREHMAGVADHKDRVWALLCFDLWTQAYL